MLGPPETAGSRRSTAGLLVANAVPLVGVVAFGWSAHALLVIYWLESAVVGASFYAKIRRARGEDDPAALPSMSFNDRAIESFVGEESATIARFYLTHYGGFWAIHGFFVLAFGLAMPALRVADPLVVAVAVLPLAGYHVVSYRSNFVGDREYERVGPVTMMVEPYRRVLVLHVTVVLGAFAVAALGTPFGMVALLVVLKTALDLWGHWSEHERAARPGVGSATG